MSAAIPTVEPTPLRCSQVFYIVHKGVILCANILLRSTQAEVYYKQATITLGIENVGGMILPQANMNADAVAFPKDRSHCRVLPTFHASLDECMYCTTRRTKGCKGIHGNGTRCLLRLSVNSHIKMHSGGCEVVETTPG